MFRVLHKNLTPTQKKQRKHALIAHHCLFPDKAHSLLDAVDSFGDQGEVIFTNSFLGGAVSAVRTAHHLEVPTVSRQQNEVKSSTNT